MNERRRVKINELIINPSNARFVIPLDVYDEKIAIEAICNDKENRIDILLVDIAKNNLNANILPIVMPSEVFVGKYDVMDGNRRLTCVKLLLQYRTELSKFNIPKNIMSAIKKIKNVNVEDEIECLYSDDETYVNDLLEKLHTHKTGVSTVEWKSLAQERHNYKKGELTRVNTIVRFLETSKYSNEDIISNLNENGWVHKFKRFVSNNKTVMNYFGFDFSKDLEQINMFIHEEEIVRGLGKLLEDCIARKADGFAQKEEDRNEYLYNFEQQKVVNKLRINDPVLIYYINDGHISATTLTPLSISIDENNKKENHTNKNDIKQSICIDENEKNIDTLTNNIGTTTENNKKKDDSSTESNNQAKHNQSRREYYKNNTTEARTYLIPRTITYRVTEQRSIDLLEELQNTPVKGHRNLIAIGFRSFIEFSVNVFIDKKSVKYNGNGKNLIDKIRHTVSKLESVYGQTELKNVIPKIYQLLNTKNDSTSEFGDIAMFNLFVHHHKFHPQEDELKVIYNNYEPYLKLLWDEIDKK